MLPCARMNVALASDYQQISRHTQEDHSERGSSCPPPPDSSQARGTSSGDVAGLGAAPRLLLSGAGLEQDGDTPCGQQLLRSVSMPSRFSSRLHCSKQKQTENRQLQWRQQRGKYQAAVPQRTRHPVALPEAAASQHGWCLRLRGETEASREMSHRNRATEFATCSSKA